MVVARRIVADLDRPKKTYRVTYTITEFDAGKRIGTQHFALIIVSGQRTTLKQGSKVPVATGTYKDGSASAQAQFTYLDVGMNIDASIEDSSTGLRLKSKVEQSSIADSSVIADVKEPIIRQSVIEGILPSQPGQAAGTGRDRCSRQHTAFRYRGCRRNREVSFVDFCRGNDFPVVF